MEPVYPLIPLTLVHIRATTSLGQLPDFLPYLRKLRDIRVAHKLPVEWRDVYPVVLQQAATARDSLTQLLAGWSCPCGGRLDLVGFYARGVTLRCIGPRIGASCGRYAMKLTDVELRPVGYELWTQPATAGQPLVLEAKV